MRSALLVFGLGAFLLPLAGCSGDGSMDSALGGVIGSVTGTSSTEMQYVGAAGKAFSAATFSDEDAREIGQSVAVGITNEPSYRLTADDSLNAYVTKVGLTIAAVSPRPEISYTFGVLESAEPNAFSMPGGYIFITRGALQRMQDESELAGVLAHEVGHVVRDHAKKAIQGSKWLEAGVQAGTAEAELQAARGVISNAVDMVLTKPFSRGDEEQADAEAVKYAKLAGYDPMGLARYLQRVSGGQSAGASAAFRTHPITADRVRKIQGYAGGAAGATLQERFRANVTAQ